MIDTNAHLIYGIQPGTTKTAFETGCVTINGYAKLEYQSSNLDFGTGTKVNLINNATNMKIDDYTIVIFGDVNGDGNIDSIDAGSMVDYENYMLTWDPNLEAAQLKAGDLNGDGNIDSIDAGIAVDTENYLLMIDQLTGLSYIPFPESDHPYADNSDQIWVYTHPQQVASLAVTFSSETYVEYSCDYIIISDGEDNMIAQYTGDELAGRTVVVAGNIFKIHLTSDSSETGYGFSITGIRKATEADMFDVEDGVLVLYRGSGGVVTIPDNVTSIGYGAFEGCSGLMSLTIPESVTSIEDWAFEGCNNLIIQGTPGSYAQEYADACGIPFLPLVQGFYLPKLPNKKVYQLGDVLDLTGLRIVYVNDEGLATDIAVEDCLVSGYDLNTLGEQMISLTYLGKTVTFIVFIVEVLYPESDHPYANGIDQSWTYTHPDSATHMLITFSLETQVESGFDYICIYDGNDNLVGNYTGDDLAGKTITVPGTSFSIKLTSDDSVTSYGFSITGITAEY